MNGVCTACCTLIGCPLDTAQLGVPSIWRDIRLFILASFFIMVSLTNSILNDTLWSLSAFLTGIIRSQHLLIQNTLSSKEISTKLTWRCSHTFCFPISISLVVPPSCSISFAATSIMRLISALFSGHADTLWIATHWASRYRKTEKLKVLLHRNYSMGGTVQIQHLAIQLILF